MTRTTAGVALATTLGAQAGTADRPTQNEPQRYCGRVVSLSCDNPSGPMTMRVRIDREHEFTVRVPGPSREAFGPRPEDRYADRTVCVTVRAVKDRKAVVESPSDIEMTDESKDLPAPLPPGVYGGCDPGVSAPTVRREVWPRYPSAAMQARIQGAVVMRVVVNADGTVGDIVVVDKLSRDLDSAAVAAVKEWRFAPGTREGVPVPVVVRIELSFHLR